MALRCLLVGLVASLGFELPSGQEVTSWTRPGRDWVAARTITLADIQANPSSWFGREVPTSAPTPAPAPALAATAPATPEAAIESIPDDLAFAAVGEAMATSFAADIEVARRENPAPPAEPAPAPAAEEVAAVEVESQPELDSMALVHPEPAATPPGRGADAEIEADPTPTSRLTSAVRATREAMSAWGSLVQAVGREVVAR